MSMPTGKGLGGGSAINSMSWSRGHPLDYDGWRDSGAEGSA
ncbi:MAG TPA: GMC family oxidoreductase N-terminal domain-containing protein [Aldersonia sp.]